MAMQKNNAFTGAVGPVVFFTRNGKQGFRARPQKVKQTKNMKGHARRFGAAAAISSSLRSCLEDVLSDTKEPKMRYRLNHTIAKWLKALEATKDTMHGDFATLDNFQFNEKALLPEKMRWVPVVDWSDSAAIRVDIPALTPARDISAPAKTKSLCLSLVAVTCYMKDSYTVSEVMQREIPVPYSQQMLQQQSIWIPMKTSNKQLTVLVLALQYFNSEAEKNEEEHWMPAAIIGYRYTGNQSSK
jgi:hypothetical protein